MSKKFLRPGAVVAACALLLAGCGSGGEKAGPGAPAEFSGKLTILTKFGGDTLSPYFQDLAKAYTEKHPDVTFELVQETDQSIKDKTKTMVASKTLPDIYFTWAGDWAEQFVASGAAADLSDVIAPDTEWGKEFGTASLDAFKWDGKYYAVPLYLDAKFMGYNKSAFSKAGVEEPKSFDELIASCGPLRAAGYSPIAFGNKDGWPAMHYLTQLVAYNVSDTVVREDFKPATAKLDDPGYLKAMEQFQRLSSECNDTGKDANGVLYTSAQEAFSSGRAAMYYQEILEFDNWKDSSIAQDFAFFALPFPNDAAGAEGMLAGAPEAYMINAGSPRQALAIDFMKFVTEKKNAETMVKAPYGQPSTVKGAVNPETASQAVTQGVEAINQAKGLMVWLDTATVPDVADAWLSGGESLVSADKTPDAVLQEVKKASDSAK